MTEPIILASGSPRRRDLLRMAGIDFEICQCEVDETQTGKPDEVVRQLAEKKAQAAYLHYPKRIILAADTLVFAGSKSLGKPKDESEAFDMLKLLQGAWHEVFTGVCLINRDIKKTKTAFEMTRVQFVSLDDAQIKAYIDSGEPFDKAGAYAIQGIAGMFISRIEGSYSNVVGLPLHLIKVLLEEAKLKLL